MKNNILKIFTLFFILTNISVKAQVYSNGMLGSTLSGTNYFLDASNFQGKVLKTEGRLLGFPRTDLTTFNFILGPIDSDDIPPNYFDGTLVYNTSTGLTVTGQGIQKSVNPGFYYFSNPTAGMGGSVTTGEWKKVGSADVVNNINNIESITNNLIDGSPVYSFKTSFTANGAATKYVLTNIPADIKNLYRITIYNSDKSVFVNSVYSFNPTTKEIVTGAPLISAVYKADTYNVILEYLK